MVLTPGGILVDWLIVDTDDKRRVGRSEVDSLIRLLLALDVDPDRAMIDEEIVRRRLAVS